MLVSDLSDREAREKIQAWLEQKGIKVLSVGGPAENTSLGIGDRAYALLRSVFGDL